MSAAVVSWLFWKWTFGDGVACGHGGGGEVMESSGSPWCQLRARSMPKITDLN